MIKFMIRKNIENSFRTSQTTVMSIHSQGHSGKKKIKIIFCIVYKVLGRNYSNILVNYQSKQNKTIVAKNITMFNKKNKYKLKKG